MDSEFEYFGQDILASLDFVWSQDNIVANNSVVDFGKSVVVVEHNIRKRQWLFGCSINNFTADAVLRKK